jgi:hypothetical protein
LLPLHHAVISFRTDKHALLRFTNACTTASGHQGENEFPLSHADAPAFKPRGKTPSFTTAPPHLLLVMPAIEPGWESSLQVPLPSSLRAQPCSFLTPCSFRTLAVWAAMSPSSSWPAPCP